MQLIHFPVKENVRQSGRLMQGGTDAQPRIIRACGIAEFQLERFDKPRQRGQRMPLLSQAIAVRYRHAHKPVLAFFGFRFRHPRNRLCSRSARVARNAS